MDHIWKREVDGGQSDVFKDGNTCVKVYSGIQRDDIVLYHTIQSQLCTRVCTILTKVQQYQGQEVREVEVQFLLLDENSVESQKYSRTGISQVTTRVPFIEGQSFAEAFSKDPMFWEFVQKRVIRFLRQQVPSLSIGANQLARHNIKVVWFAQGTLKLLVTDIAQNIRTFIDANKDKVEQLTYLRESREK